MLSRFVRPGALLVLLAVLLSGSIARASLGLGVRGGISDDPDQILVGGHLRLIGLIPSAPQLWFEPNATVGFGDHLTVIQVSADFKYAFPVGRMQLYPLAGLSYVHYKLDSDFCNDCSGSETGLHLGGGLVYGQIGGDLVLDVTDDLPDLRLMVHFTF